MDLMEHVGTLGGLLWGTLLLRPYVFAFLACFVILGARDLGAWRALGFLGWGWLVAFVAEYASTRVGVPFGLYQYTGETAEVELFLSNVPFFDSLSFPFLAYASFCLARYGLARCALAGPADRRAQGIVVTALAGGLMMLLDVVIDPLAVRGERWFLGRVFFYPEGGAYFGVPLSNFAGWAGIGCVIVGGYVWVTRGSGPPPGSPRPGIGLYYGILVFNLAVTLAIGEIALLALGILMHGATLLLLLASKGLMPRGAGIGWPHLPLSRESLER